MNWGKILSYAICLLCTGAGIGYALVGDWRRGAYFFLAAAMNFVLTL